MKELKQRGEQEMKQDCINSNENPTLFPFKDTQYIFGDNEPKTGEDFSTIISDLTPKAAAAYLICCNAHNNNEIKRSDINRYLSCWQDSDVDNVITELTKLGYMEKVPVVDLYDIELTPSCSISSILADKINHLIKWKASPITIGVYMACIVYHDDGCINYEILLNNTKWNRQHIDCSLKELEKLGAIVDSDTYYESNGNKINIYKIY